MEGLILSRSVDESRVFGSFVSPLTGRVFEGSEDVWVDGAEGRPFDKDPGVDAAGKRLSARAAKWAETDARMAEIFNVSLRKVAVSIDDARAFSDADTKNLLSILHMGRLVTFARSVGIEAGTKDKKLAKFIREHDGSAYIHSDFGLAKNMVVELLLAVPGLELGAFVAEKKGEDAFSIKLKNGMGGEIVDRRGSSVLLSDGTLIGEPFVTKKVREFLVRYGRILASSGDFREIARAVEKINEIGDRLTSEEQDSLFSEHLKNSLFGFLAIEGRYEAKPATSKAVLAGRKFAFESLKDQGVSPSDFVGMFVNIMNDSLYSRWREDGDGLGGTWWGDEEEAKIKSGASAFADFFLAGVEDLSPSLAAFVATEIRSAAAAQAAERATAAAALGAMRGVVLGKLAEAGKPATERRVSKLVDEYVNEFRIAGLIYGRTLMGYFKDDVQAAENEEKKKADVANEKTKARATSGKFRHAAVKNGETAFIKLRELWESLSDEAVVYLFGVAAEGDCSHREFSEWILGDEARTKKIMKLVDSPSVWKHLPAKSRVLTIAVSEGPGSLVEWDWLDQQNVAGLVTELPPEKIDAAFKLLTKNMRGGYTSQESSSAADALLSRLGRGDGVEVISKNLEDLKDVLVSRGEDAVINQVLWKHVRRWGAAGDNKGYMSVYLTAALLNGAEGEIAGLLEKAGDDFLPLKLASSIKGGRAVEAVRIVKGLMAKADVPRKKGKKEDDEDDDDNDVGNPWAREDRLNKLGGFLVQASGDYGDKLQVRFLSKMVNDNQYNYKDGVSVDDLFGVDVVALDPDGAAALLEFASGRGVTKPCSVERLKLVFKAAGTAKKDQIELVGKFFGEGRKEWVDFVHEVGGLKREEIVAAIAEAMEFKSKDRNSYYEGIEFRLENNMMTYFNDLVAKNSIYLNVSNIRRLSAAATESLSDVVLAAALVRARGLLSETSGGSRGRISSVEDFLSVFRYSEEYSTRVLVESGSFTPKQAVAAAKVLHPGAVRKCSAKIFEAVRGKKEDMEAVLPFVDLGELDEAQAKLLRSLPSHVAVRIMEGDMDVSDAEWKKFFADAEAVAKVLLWASLDGKTKLLKQMRALADTYEADVASAYQIALQRVAKKFLSPGIDLEPLATLAKLGGADEDLTLDVLKNIMFEEVDYVDPDDLSGFETFASRLRAMATALGVDGVDFSRSLSEKLISNLTMWHKRLDVPSFVSVLKKTGISTEFKEEFDAEFKKEIEEITEQLARSKSRDGDEEGEEDDEENGGEDEDGGEEGDEEGGGTRRALFRRDWESMRSTKGLKNRAANLTELSELLA